MKIENWRVYVDENANPFLPLRQAPKYIMGLVDGVEIKTPILLSFDLEKRVAKSENEVYELGEMSNEFYYWLEMNSFDLGKYCEIEE